MTELYKKLKFVVKFTEIYISKKYKIKIYLDDDEIGKIINEAFN